MNFFAFVSRFVPRVVVVVFCCCCCNSKFNRLANFVAVVFFIVGEIRQRRKSNYRQRQRQKNGIGSAGDKN